jgi:hypothetical protein
MSQNFLALGGLARRGTKLAAHGCEASGVDSRVFGTLVTCSRSAAFVAIFGGWSGHGPGTGIPLIGPALMSLWAFLCPLISPMSASYARRVIRWISDVRCKCFWTPNCPLLGAYGSCLSWLDEINVISESDV